MAPITNHHIEAMGSGNTKYDAAAAADAEALSAENAAIDAEPSVPSVPPPSAPPPPDDPPGGASALYDAPVEAEGAAGAAAAAGPALSTADKAGLHAAKAAGMPDEWIESLKVRSSGRKRSNSGRRE